MLYSSQRKLFNFIKLYLLFLIIRTVKTLITGKTINKFRVIFGIYNNLLFIQALISGKKIANRDGHQKIRYPLKSK